MPCNWKDANTIINFRLLINVGLTAWLCFLMRLFQTVKVSCLGGSNQSSQGLYLSRTCPSGLNTSSLITVFCGWVLCVALVSYLFQVENSYTGGMQVLFAFRIVLETMLLNVRTSSSLGRAGVVLYILV